MRILRFIDFWCSQLGINPLKARNTLRAIPWFFRDRRQFLRQAATAEVKFAWGRLYPCLDDRYDKSGWTKGHYFLQDVYVAQRVFTHRAVVHVDVGSRIDGFVAHVAAFREIRVIDIRPLETDISNIRFMQGDLMKPLAATLEECCDSLSCLHTLEHFGLGRYGDPVDHDGYRAGFANLHRMIRPGGRFYFSTIIGPQRVEFNAHRVFAVQTLLDLFRDRFVVERFSYIDDQARLHIDCAMTEETVSSNFNCHGGCGIFELIKR